MGEFSHRASMAAAFVYLLRCADDSLYCGWTTDLEARLAAHNAGTGAKYTRGRRPVVLAYHEECPDRSAAMKREWRIKRLTRLAKERLARERRRPRRLEENLRSSN